MKKSTLLKISPIMLLLSLLAGSVNVAFADEKAADKSDTASEKESSADDEKKGEKKGEEPDCD